MTLDPAWIALIGTICGGVGLKFAEHWLGRRKVKADDATQIRNELRQQYESKVQELRDAAAELKETEEERDFYRNKYYEVMNERLAEQTANAEELRKLREEAFNNVERQRTQGRTSEPTPLLDKTDPNHVD